MNCAISGVICREPVVSVKSGHVFEKSLIEEYVHQNGTCPVTNEELAKEDLVPIRQAEVVAPRTTSATSVPGVLQLLQSEWDSVMLEVFNLKQQLNSTRQELAKTLYKHDAACRVVARLMTERDQARQALASATGVSIPSSSSSSSSSSHVSQNASTSNGTGSGSAMEVEQDGSSSSSSSTSLPSSVASALGNVADGLVDMRKKIIKERKSAVSDISSIKKYDVTSSNPLHSTSKAGIISVDIDSSNTHVATGGVDSKVIVFNRGSGKIEHTLKGHSKKVNAVKFHPTNSTLFSCSADHTARVWLHEDGKYVSGIETKDHTSEVTGLCVHNTGDYFVTASKDASWKFYDVTTPNSILSVNEETDSAFTSIDFHPDGLIVAGGTEAGFVRVYDVKSASVAASFQHDGHAVSSIAFSDNGYHLATGDAIGNVKFWDLRKLVALRTIDATKKVAVRGLSFDSSGSYLAIGSSELRVFNVKPFELISSFNVHKKDITGLVWGENASFIATTSRDRHLKILSQ